MTAQQRQSPGQSNQRARNDMRDRVGKYSQYFKGDTVLPIPEPTKAADGDGRLELSGLSLCSVAAEEQTPDFQFRKALKRLYNFKEIKVERVSNPYLFRGAPMLTTFVRSAGTCNQGVWRFLEKASQADMILVELEHSSLKKMVSYCSERVPIL